MKDKQAEREAFFDFFKTEQEKQNDKMRGGNIKTPGEIKRLDNERTETGRTDKLLQADLLCGV